MENPMVDTSPLISDVSLLKKAGRSLIYGVISVLLVLLPLVPLPFAILGILSGNKGKHSSHRRRALMGIVFSWIGLVLSLIYSAIFISILFDDSRNSIKSDTELTLNEPASSDSIVLLNLPTGVPLLRDLGTNHNTEGFVVISDDKQHVAYYWNGVDRAGVQKNGSPFFAIDNSEIPLVASETIAYGSYPNYSPPFFTTKNKLIYTLKHTTEEDGAKTNSYFVASDKDRYGPYESIIAVSLTPDGGGFQFVARKNNEVVWVTNGVESEIVDLQNEEMRKFRYRTGVDISSDNRHIGLPLESDKSEYYVIDGRHEKRRYEKVRSYNHINGHHVYCGVNDSQKELLAVQDDSEYPLTWNRDYWQPDFAPCHRYAINQNYQLEHNNERSRILLNDTEIRSYNRNEYFIDDAFFVSQDSSRAAFIIKKIHSGIFTDLAFSKEKKELCEYSVLVLGNNGEVDNTLTTNYTNVSSCEWGIGNIFISPDMKHLGYFVRKVDPEGKKFDALQAVVDGKENPEVFKDWRYVNRFMTFSPDGHHYAFAFSTGNYFMWKDDAMIVLDGKRVLGEIDAVFAIDFSADSNKLIVIYAKGNEILREEIELKEN